MGESFEKAFQNYFSVDPEMNVNRVKQVDGTGDVYTHAETPRSFGMMNSRSRMTASGNVDDIDKLGEILRKLLNTAWGSDWGTLSPETSRGDDAEKIIVPQINYSINLREVTEGTSPKPTLIDTVSEVVNGEYTGDAFKVFRQSFDCIVEFNFWAATSKDTRALMNRFESLVATYTGYLKDQGISEIFFLKEVPSKYSLNYADGSPMKCLYYFVRIERFRTERVSTLNEMEMRLSMKGSMSTGENPVDINKITYKL